MEKSYSQEEDCIKLAHIFKVQLGEKIDYYNLGNIPGGKYLSSFRINNGEYMFNGRYLPFYFKFNKIISQGTTPNLNVFEMIFSPLLTTTN